MDLIVFQASTLFTVPSLRLTIHQVEDTLFKVPRQYFVENSSIFQDMFSIPQVQIEGSSPEGLSAEKPLRLDGISQVDFERLIKVIYPSSAFSHQLNLRTHIDNNPAGRSHRDTT